MTVQRTRAQSGQAMFEHVCNGTTEQADSIMSVPAENYMGAERWSLEIEKIFKKLPLILGWSAELPNRNDYKTMDVIGMPLLVTRGSDGEVRVFLNVCTHRGAPLAKDANGTCNRFTCSYHGWTFANDGRLIGIADKAKFGDLDERTRGLKRLPAAERGGLIFAVLTPGALIDLDQYYGEMLREIETFNLQGWTACGKRELTSPNWKIAIDGYIENYHFATTHPTTIAPYIITDVMTFDPIGPHIRVGATLTDVRNILAGVAPEDFPRFENNGYEFVRLLFPSTTFTIRPDVTYLTQIFPGATPGESHTTLTFIHPASATDEDKTRAQTLMDSIAEILRTEDYRINFGVQKNLQSGALDDVVFGRNEAANQFFHKCTDYYVKSDPGAPFPKL
jgi:phenylpropionate dioxygenase-like ring-hydroxylating dioxygenase large terminal subunit